MSFYLQTSRHARFRTALRKRVVIVVAVAVVAAGAGTALVATNGASAAPCAGPFDNFSCSGSATPALPAGYLTPPPTTDPGPRQFILSGPDTPDPFMMRIGASYELYTSGGNLPLNIPSYRGPAPGDWGPAHDAMPNLPSWAVHGYTWGPDVRKVQGGWALYYTAVRKNVNPSMQCIGAAFASSPYGPFVSEETPFVCQAAHLGDIDPRTFVDGHGQLWLDWKSDDNADPNVYGLTRRTGLWAQRLSADGRTLLGSPTEVLQPTKPWESTILESPQMAFVNGVYWLFFSANWFNQPAYAIGVARCSGPAGPCVDISDHPFIASNQQGDGPGEPSVFAGPTGMWLLYNPWKSNVPTYTPPRPTVMVRLGFTSAGPYVAQS